MRGIIVLTAWLGDKILDWTLDFFHLVEAITPAIKVATDWGVSFITLASVVSLVRKWLKRRKPPTYKF